LHGARTGLVDGMNDPAASALLLGDSTALLPRMAERGGKTRLTKLTAPNGRRAGGYCGTDRRQRWHSASEGFSRDRLELATCETRGIGTRAAASWTDGSFRFLAAAGNSRSRGRKQRREVFRPRRRQGEPVGLEFKFSMTKHAPDAKLGGTRPQTTGSLYNDPARTTRWLAPKAGAWHQGENCRDGGGGWWGGLDAGHVEHWSTAAQVLEYRSAARRIFCRVATQQG